MVEAPQRRLLRREERQASILHGAAAAFARTGFAATSMEDVADACGVTKLIVYRHFDSKEELYRAILQRVFDRQAEELLRGLEHPPQPGLGTRTLLTVAREDPAAFTLLWRHAPREAQFAAYALELRSMSVRRGARADGDLQRRRRLRRVGGRGRDRLAGGVGADLVGGRRPRS